MNRQKHEIPDAYRGTEFLQDRREVRHEVYTDFSLYGTLMPMDPEFVGRINGK